MYKKARDARAKLFFCQSKSIAFLLLYKLPIVVIQKFCYHSNVTVALLLSITVVPREIEDNG